MVAIDFHNIFSMLWKSMATINILQNIFFCVQQNKDTPKGLEQPRVGDDKVVIFEWTSL